MTFTANDTILWSVGIFSLLMFWIKSLVIIILWSDWRNGDSNFDKNFSRLYVEVLILEIISSYGRSLRFPVTGNLCIFAVP